VASLRDLLEHPSLSAVIEHRWVPVTPAAAITSAVAIADLEAWYQGAIGELQGTLSAQDIVASGPPGGIYANELFADAPQTGGIRTALAHRSAWRSLTRCEQRQPFLPRKSK
jgi:hypothetical protein